MTTYARTITLDEIEYDTLRTALAELIEQCRAGADGADIDAKMKEQRLLSVENQLFRATYRMTSTSSSCWPGGVIPDDIDWGESPAPSDLDYHDSKQLR